MNRLLYVQALIAKMKNEGMSDEIFYRILSSLVVEVQPFCIELNEILFHDPESRMLFTKFIRLWEGDNLIDVPHIQFGFEFNGEGYIENVLLFKNTTEYKTISIRQN
jgi:hypothetical protein